MAASSQSPCFTLLKLGLQTTDLVCLRACLLYTNSETFPQSYWLLSVIKLPLAWKVGLTQNERSSRKPTTCVQIHTPHPLIPHNTYAHIHTCHTHINTRTAHTHIAHTHAHMHTSAACGDTHTYSLKSHNSTTSKDKSWLLPCLLWKWPSCCTVGIHYNEYGIQMNMSKLIAHQSALTEKVSFLGNRHL